MKKICLSFVLSVVSVFSISAQTNYKTIDKSGLGEIVKTGSESLENRIESTETTAETVETDSSKKEKPAAEKPVNSPDASILSIKESALGSFSTGDASIDGYIEEFCSLYGVDPLLIYAQMHQESSFKGRAVSPKGASGFMQLMPDTARRFGVKNIYNPKQNIQAGIKYMRWLLDKFSGDMRLALAGYNAGEGAVIKYGNKIPPFRETQNYVDRIMNHYESASNHNSALAEAINNNFSKVY
jgi:soluble lytic murein transglycosylase-like protein